MEIGCEIELELDFVDSYKCVFFLKETFEMTKNSPEEVEKKMKTTDQDNLSKCFQCA